MTVAPDVDMKAERLFQISWGLIYKVVCAPKHWTAEQVSAEATKNDPPGTSQNRWETTNPESLDDDHPFKAGNPLPCNDDDDRRHWLVNC